MWKSAFTAFIGLALLQLMGAIDFSWWWIFAPLWWVALVTAFNATLLYVGIRGDREQR